MVAIRKRFLWNALAATLWLMQGCSDSGPKNEKNPLKPNVLFIAVDDLRAELGVYGSFVKSPYMDSLARQGSLFHHHYVQAPTCGASRHALLTGYRPWKPEHLSNDALEKGLSGTMETDTPETFIHRLKKEGYYTLGIGKISHSADGYVYGYEETPSNVRELPHSWNELRFDPGRWTTGWNAFFAYADGSNRQSRNKQVRPYEAGEVDDMGYPDGRIAQLGREALRDLKKRNEPFFLGVGFFKPHLPFNAPKRYWDLYDPDSIPLSPNPDIPEQIHPQSLHESGEFNQYALGEEKASLARSVPDSYARKLRWAYAAAISYVDAQIGSLLAELNALGLADNTIVVLWGDHGWHLGDQRVWGKHTLFENSLRSTLIVRSPFLETPVREIDVPVETVDLYPTLLELCGLRPEPYRDGTSLVPLMRSGHIGADSVAYGYFRRGITVRTPRYRLTRYYREEEPTVELYDYGTDPHETQNQAEQRPEVVESLLPLLEMGDTGIYGH